MAQIIAICILAIWIGWGLYLYRVDPGNERYWSGNPQSFLLGVLLRSAAFTLFTCTFLFVITALLCTASGVMK